MPSMVNLVLALGACVLLFATLHDVAFRTIPDWVPLSLALGGGALRAIDRQGPSAVAAGLAVLALATFCWWRRWLGGGDVKLLGATALLVPPALVPAYMAAVALAGGALALLYLLLERVAPAIPLRRDASLARRVAAVECRRIRRRESLPYAAAICAAAVLILTRE